MNKKALGMSMAEIKKLKNLLERFSKLSIVKAYHLESSVQEVLQVIENNLEKYFD